MTNELLEQALYYANVKKWFVFPCWERQSSYVDEKGETQIIKVKSPYTTNGFLDATQNIEQIKKWWNRYYEAAIGISCGHSNLICIDIDVRKANGFENFMRLGISDEGALHSVTPSGGSHVIFSGSIYSQANIKAGVDIRSIGAYFLAPPSRTYDTNNKKSFYIATDDWTQNPVSAPTSLTEQLKFLRTQGEHRERKVVNESLETTVEKAQKALNSLPQEYCDEYFMWINIGMSLYELGDTGLDMWVNWSRKSSKFELEACIKRWEKFAPRDITINSLFFYAREAEKSNG